MTLRARAAAFSVSAALTFLAHRAGAQDAAAAQALFADAKRLMAEGRYADACPKLEESERLDPGMGTLYNLADCNAHVGRTASAWAAFLEVAAQARSAGQLAREKVARERAAQLEGGLARLTIEVPVGARLEGLVIQKDGVGVGPGQWGAAIPTDPGDRRVAAAAPGHAPWETRVRVPASGGVTIAVPILAAAPAEPLAAAPPDPAPPVPAPPAPRAVEPSGLPAQRVVALTAAGAGAVALGVAGVLAAQAVSKKGASEDAGCVANRCTAEGLAIRNDARGLGDAATVAAIAGGALVAAGVVLWFTAPSHRGASIGVGPGGAVVAGRF